MKRFFALGLVALLTANADPAHAQLDSKLKAFLQVYDKNTPFPPDETLRVSVATVDLRGDGAKEVLVYLNGQKWCGSGGCPLLVLVADGSSFKVISKTTITRPPIRILPSRSYGWKDLGVTVAGGGIPRAYVAKLPFDGSGYARNPTLPPATRAKNPQGIVVIPKESRGEPLYP